MLRFTTSIPTPRPDTSVTFSAVENPGLKMSIQICSSDKLVGFCDQSLFDAFGQNLVSIETSPIVLHGDADIAALVEGIEANDAPAQVCRPRCVRSVVRDHDPRSFARGASMDHRWTRSRSYPVRFPRRTESNESSYRLCREIADKAREAAKGISDRNHTNAHHTFLNLARVTLELRHAFQQDGQLAHLESGTQITEHGLRNDEFAHQIDQPINLDGVYTDRRVSAFFVGGVPSD